MVLSSKTIHKLKKDIKSDKTLYFNELLIDTSTEIEFEQVPFDHPVYIMYSSGTTGNS